MLKKLYRLIELEFRTLYKVDLVIVLFMGIVQFILVCRTKLMLGSECIYIEDLLEEASVDIIFYISTVIMLFIGVGITMYDYVQKKKQPKIMDFSISVGYIYWSKIGAVSIGALILIAAQLLYVMILYGIFKLPIFPRNEYRVNEFFKMWSQSSFLKLIIPCNIGFMLLNIFTVLVICIMILLIPIYWLNGNYIAWIIPAIFNSIIAIELVTVRLDIWWIEERLLVLLPLFLPFSIVVSLILLKRYLEGDNL